MYFERNAQTSTRMANAADSEKVYRWVVFLLRTSYFKDLSGPNKKAQKDQSYCAGNVLTEK